MKRFLTFVVLTITMALAACNPADIASRNLSVAADNFEIMRRVVFYNGITDAYILEVTGFCSIGNDNTSSQFTITCKDATGFKKHFLGLSDNVTYFAEQVEGENVSTFHTRVLWRPQSILPDIDFQGDVQELITDTN